MLYDICPTKVYDHCVIPKRVFIAGAYTAPSQLDLMENMRKGMKLGLKVLLAGFSPFVPWFDYQFLLLQEGKEVTTEMLYNYSLSWLERSDALLLVEGWQGSAGSLQEIRASKNLGIPVFEHLDDLIRTFKDEILPIPKVPNYPEDDLYEVSAFCSITNENERICFSNQPDGGVLAETIAKHPYYTKVRVHKVEK